jgi:hypothetical protein
MRIDDAQRDVRTTFLGGFAGQLVSGALWLGAAALGTWSSPRRAILLLVVGGMFIFPLTQGVLRLMRRRATLASGSPMNGLAMQVAFTVPLMLPVALGATLHRLDWFFPACMVVVGAHYLPFVFLYGMPMFAALGGILVAAGLALALWVPEPFAAGGWLTGAVLWAFALAGRAQVAREQGAAGSTAG